MESPRILYVDPQAERRSDGVDRLRTALADLDPVIEPAESVSAAVAAADQMRVDCLVTEYDLPDGTGLDIAAKVRERSPDAGCVLLTETDPDNIPTDEVADLVVEYVPQSVPNPYDRLAEIVRMAVTDDVSTSYPRPAGEHDRLAVLEAYDFANEQLQTSLERIIDLAINHFGTDSAAVTIVGDHDQEFLVCQGLVGGGDPIHRDDSVCTFAIVADDPVMVVRDVQADPRFSDVTTLAEAGISFYMGAPLRVAGGHAIGTLCIHDSEPQTVSADDRAFLRTLADLAEDIIAQYPANGGESA